MANSRKQFPKSFREFEEASAQFLQKYLGDSSAKVTSEGVDGGIDVIGDKYCGQSKFYSDKSVSRPEVQQLLGASSPHGRSSAFFAFLGGYTKEAIEFAKVAKVLLFQFDPDEVEFVAVNNWAREALDSAIPQTPPEKEPQSSSLRKTNSSGVRRPNGFYPDPYSDHLFRYWDGDDWTSTVKLGVGQPFLQEPY